MQDLQVGWEACCRAPRREHVVRKMEFIVFPAVILAEESLSFRYRMAMDSSLKRDTRKILFGAPSPPQSLFVFRCDVQQLFHHYFRRSNTTNTTLDTRSTQVQNKADCIVGVYCDWVYNAKCIVGVYSDWLYNAKCIVGTAHMLKTKCIVGTTHVKNKAGCIVGVSGNHDNDTRVGERKIGAPFLLCSPRSDITLVNLLRVSPRSGFLYV